MTPEGAGLAMIIGSVIIFLVCREIVLWYFRLNQMANSLAYLESYFRRLEESKLAQAKLQAQKEAQAKLPAQQAIYNGITPTQK
jgi:hypothetical protein